MCTACQLKLCSNIYFSFFFNPNLLLTYLHNVQLLSLNTIFSLDSIFHAKLNSAFCMFWLVIKAKEKQLKILPILLS